MEMIGTGYLLAFTTGLLGGFGHCIGMCGPLVASYTLHSAASRTRIIPHLMYNAGRITTYTFIGSLMGLAGNFLNTAGKLAGIQNIAAMLTGILMIAAGLSISGCFKSASFIGSRNSFVLKAVKIVVETDSPLRYYPLGLLLGLLPCGLSYSVFIGAAGAGGLLQGMLYVFCFGLGTLPALLLVGVIMTYVSIRIRGWLYRASGVAVAISGVYFLVRGIASSA
jgi:sulfite exporter TauE/SafE